MKNAANPGIWKKLLVLGDKHGPVKLSDLALDMAIDADEALIFLRQIFPTGSNVEIYHEENECWVDFKGNAEEHILSLSTIEWIQLHHILLTHKSIETTLTHSLKSKVFENGPIKAVMELFNQFEQWDQELSEVPPKLLHQIDHAVLEKQLLNLTTTEGKIYSVYPCRLLHLEGQLSVIGEDSHDHCLIIIPLKELKSITQVPSHSSSKVSQFEIEEFISAVRAMNEKETRLILKIHNHQSVNLFPDHHFLGKPCMVTNPNGELIWAAYVEPCDALFEWVITLGKNVEILDPHNFKKEYLDYCEEKMRKIA